MHRGQLGAADRSFAAPFAALRTRLRMTTGGCTKGHSVAADRSFAALRMTTGRQLRVMRMRADKSALGAMNRPLQMRFTGREERSEERRVGKECRCGGGTER